MGRGKGVPYMDPTLNYEDVEPDLTKAVNNNIDEQIKDSQQFFRDNIELFNKSLAARDKRWSDLASITKDGANLIDAYKDMKENRGELKRLSDLGNDNNWVNKWSTDSKTFEEVDAGLYKGIKVQLGEAEDAIGKLGYYEVKNEKGEVVGIIDNTNLGEFQETVQSTTELRGSNAAKQVAILIPGYFDIAYTDMRHRETGLLFDQLTNPQQKLEYLEETSGLLLRIIKKNNPRISDGDLINHILPLIKNEIKKKMGTDNVTSQFAKGENAKSKELISNANIVVTTVNNSMNKVDAYDQLLDPQNGLFKTLIDYHKAKGLKGDDAFNAAAGDITEAIGFAHEFLGLTEEGYMHLTTEHEFKHSDGRMVTLAGMKDPRIDAFLKATDLKINKQIDKKEFNRQELLLNDIKNRVTENPGAAMTLQELLLFTHPELRQAAYNLYQTSQGALTIGYDSTTQAVQLINDASLLHAQTKLGLQTDGLKNRAGHYIALEANAEFAKRTNEYIKKQNKNADVAADLARRDVIQMINEGKFDDAAPTDADGLDPGKVLVANADLIAQDKDQWLNSKVAHRGEEDFAEETILMLTQGGPVPSLYVNLARYFKDFDARGLAVYRLNQLDLIPEGVDYSAYLIPVTPKVNSFLNRSLSDKPSNNKTYWALRGHPSEFAKIMPRLEKPEMKNFGGIDAYFSKETNSYENREVSKFTIPELLKDLEAGNEGDRYGIYGITNRNLLNLLTFMVKEDGIDLSNRIFDKKFQDELIMYAAYHENKKSQFLIGDTSWISRIPLDGETAEQYKKIFGTISDEDKDGNIWNEIQYLVFKAGYAKVDMDELGYDKKEEEDKK